MQHIIIITGPAGSGKTTTATSLAEHLSLPFLEGDAFHPPSNIAKMSAGHALDDADRWAWLERVRDSAVAVLQPATATDATYLPSQPQSGVPSHGGALAVDEGSTSLTPGVAASTSPATAARTTAGGAAPPRAVVVTCSALKKSYRDVLRAANTRASIKAVFVFLSLSEEQLYARVAGREGHFMKQAMVQSQLEALECPDGRERGEDTVVVDAGQSRADVEGMVEREVGRLLGLAAVP